MTHSGYRVPYQLHCPTPPALDELEATELETEEELLETLEELLEILEELATEELDDELGTDELAIDELDDELDEELCPPVFAA